MELLSVLERSFAVFGSGSATRIYLASGVTDMRKNFNGLYALVRDHRGCDPESGSGLCIEGKPTLVQASFPRRPVGLHLAPEERNASLLQAFLHALNGACLPCEDPLRRLHARCFFRHQ